MILSAAAFTTTFIAAWMAFRESATAFEWISPFVAEPRPGALRVPERSGRRPPAPQFRGGGRAGLAGSRAGVGEASTGGALPARASRCSATDPTARPVAVALLADLVDTLVRGDTNSPVAQVCPATVAGRLSPPRGRGVGLGDAKKKRRVSAAE